MESSLIKVCYEGSEGLSDIKTIMRGDILYISLIDVQNALNRENTEIDVTQKPQSILSIIKGRLEDLESDEFIYIENEELSHLDKKELFVTQPGLFRVLSHDKSAAGKKFQRWLYHDVVPSILKHGEYPPPIVTKESDVMKIAKTLVMEIGERERLERETKERFARHEEVLNSLTSELKTFKGNDAGITFMTVSEFYNNDVPEGLDLQYAFGWCLKISIEQSEPTKRLLENGTEIVRFPDYVITEAVQKILGDTD
ncbi:BRO family protein [Alteromonas mediterranea]|uniref:BRO family protein n=1 Tax=Alteromonas mediterranea TaxID=314275 RepID=UPI0012F8E214|nr:BRO family protein [Alteromonas mediterranea]QGX61701.1 hypothetical protein FJN15_08055 [Alteromonas mediterranea]